MKARTVLITGAAGGLGKALTELLLEKGYRVFAGDIDPSPLDRLLPAELFHPIKLDVTDARSISRAYQEIVSATDQLDAVVNMAGVVAIGSMVEMEEEVLRKVVDVNLFGTYRINKQFLPLLKAKGRIINMSSETGWQTAAPFNGAYAISKYGMEAYSDALRRELAFLGIKVIKIQPGPFKSQMTSKVMDMFYQAYAVSSLFKENLQKGMPYPPSVYQNANDPRHLAQVILKAIYAKRPKLAYSVRPDWKRSLLEYLPARWADWIIRKMLS